MKACVVVAFFAAAALCAHASAVLPYVDLYYTNYYAAPSLSAVTAQLTTSNGTGFSVVASMPMTACGGGLGWFWVRVPTTSGVTGVTFLYTLNGVQYHDQTANQGTGDCNSTSTAAPYPLSFYAASVYLNHPAASSADTACFGGQITTDNTHWNEYPVGTPLYCPLTTVFYYHNHAWFYDPSVNRVDLWQINSTFGVASITPLTRCSLIDDYWVTEITLAPGLSYSHVAYLPVAAHVNGTFSYDNAGCVGTANYQNMDFTQAATKLFVPYGASCGGTAMSGYEGRYTADPSKCIAIESGIRTAYTAFFYENSNFYLDGTLQSFYVRVQPKYGVTEDIPLLRCMAQNYFVAFISQPSDDPFVSSWILPFASTTSTPEGTLSFDNSVCSTSNNYDHALDFAAQNNLLNSNANGCGGTMSQPTTAVLGAPCGPIYSTYFQYRNPLWSANTNIVSVAATVIDPIGNTKFPTQLVRTSSTCWAGTLQNVDLQAPGNQGVKVTAYDASGTAILTTPCDGGIYNVNFANAFTAVDANDGCVGTPTTGVLPCPPYTPMPTPTPSAMESGTPTAVAGGADNTSLIIGVVVGVGGFLLLLVIIIVVWACRRRKATNRVKSDTELDVVNELDARSNPSTRSNTSTQVLGGSAYAPTEYRKADDAQLKDWQNNATMLNTTGEVSLPGFLRMSADQVQFIAQIGGGGNGAVQHARVVDPDWTAKNPRYREVAVKQVPGNASLTEEVNRINFLQEVSAMNALRFHPNVVTLLGYCENPPFIVTPLHKGDLFDYLMLKGVFTSRPAKWSMLAALELSEQIAASIDTVHAFNIVHRDIKTKNIVLEQIDPATTVSGFPFKPRLIDFGIARIVSQEQHDDVKGMGFVNIIGLSARYAAPEVFASVQLAKTNGMVDPEQEKKGDVYALAICMWEMVFQKIPWDDLDKDEINRRVCEEERPPIPEKYQSQADGSVENDVYVALITMIERCWHHSAKQRPSTGVINSDLSALLAKYRKP